MSPRLQRQAEWFLVEATSYSKDEAAQAVDLLIVPARRSFGLNNNHNYRRDIAEVAEAWEARGFGKFTPQGRFMFSFTNEAHAAAALLERRLSRRSGREMLRGMNWNAVNAVAAAIAAVAALAAAYFSYLAMPRH